MTKLEVKTNSQLLSTKWFILNKKAELQAKVIKDRIITLNGKEKLGLDLEDEKKNKYTLILNSSNVKFLLEQGYEDSTQLIGHSITIVVDPNVRYMNKVVGGIRIIKVE